MLSFIVKKHLVTFTFSHACHNARSQTQNSSQASLFSYPLSAVSSALRLTQDSLPAPNDKLLSAKDNQHGTQTDC